MGVRFRKSIKLAPGVRMNIGTKSAGLSFGGKGLRYSINSKGRRTSTVGIPGTGLSWSSSASSKRPSASYSKYSSAKARNDALAKERQQAADKEKQQRLEMEEARAAVEEYEARLEVITSIHKDCDDTVDWPYILSLPAPYDGEGPGPLTQKAQQNINNYVPGFFAKHFKIFYKAKKYLLDTALEDAKQKDAKEFNEWYELHNTAERVLSKDTDLMLEVIEEMAPLDDLLEFGSGFEISFINEYIVEVEFDIKADTVIPKEALSLTATGKLSKKALPVTKRLDLMQDYVCSCVLRIARDLFAILPVNNVIIHAKDDFIDTSVGNSTTRDILSVDINRETLSTLNFEAIDPSDAMVNFMHSMKFLKTKGFQPINRIVIEENEQ